jgi:hypothetical protein
LGDYHSTRLSDCRAAALTKASASSPASRTA